MSLKKLIIFALFTTTVHLLVFGNEYAVTTTNLNLRETNTKNSRVISVIENGDTLEILAIEGNWSKVKTRNAEGFVSNEYLSKIILRTNASAIVQPQSKEFKDQIGFVAGFKFVFKRTFLLLFIILGVYTAYKLRRPDARFKTGYREGKLSQFGLLKMALYSALISVVTGFIGGVISIFH